MTLIAMFVVLNQKNKFPQKKANLSVCENEYPQKFCPKCTIAKISEIKYLLFTNWIISKRCLSNGWFLQI